MGYIRWLGALALVTGLATCDKFVSERDVVGTWNARVAENDVEVLIFMELLPDHRIRVHTRTAFEEVSAESTGKWFLIGTKLITTNDKDGATGSDEVIMADANKLILADMDAPGTPVIQWTRYAGSVPRIVAPTSGELPRNVLPSAGTAPPVVPETPTPAKPAAPRQPVVVQLIDDYRLVESKDVAQYVVKLQQSSTIQIVLDIEDNTPIDVMLLPASAAKRYDSMKVAVAANETDQVIDMLGKMFGPEEAEQFKTGSKFTEADFYNRPLARKAAHRHYDTEGVLQPGDYVLFLDNSGDISKTLGDVSLHLQLFAKAAN